MMWMRWNGSDQRRLARYLMKLLTIALLGSALAPAAMWAQYQANTTLHVWKGRRQLELRDGEAVIATIPVALGTDPRQGKRFRGDRYRLGHLSGCSDRACFEALRRSAGTFGRHGANDNMRHVATLFAKRLDDRGASGDLSFGPIDRVAQRIRAAVTQCGLGASRPVPRSQQRSRRGSASCRTVDCGYRIFEHRRRQPVLLGGLDGIARNLSRLVRRYAQTSRLVYGTRLPSYAFENIRRLTWQER